MNVVAPTGEELLVARKYRENIVKTISNLVEIVLILIFAIYLFVIVYGNRGYSRCRLTLNLEDLLKYSFEKVKCCAIWASLNAPFIISNNYLVKFQCIVC